LGVCRKKYKKEKYERKDGPKGWEQENAVPSHDKTFLKSHHFYPDIQIRMPKLYANPKKGKTPILLILFKNDLFWFFMYADFLFKMYKSPLIRMLATLSRDEFESFGQYIRSPLFNSRKQPVALFYYLEETFDIWHPFLSEGDELRSQADELKVVLSKEEVAKALFPGEVFNDPRIRRVMSYCKKLLEDFLYFLESTREENLLSRHIALLRHHLRRNEYSLFEARLHEARNSLLDPSDADPKFFYQAYQIEDLANQYLVRKGVAEETFQLVSDHFDTYLLLSKLRIFSGMLNREKKYKASYRYDLLPEITDFIERNQKSQPPLVILYYYILRLEQPNASPGDFVMLRKVLEENSSSISSDETRQIYGFMLNYLIRESRNTSGSRDTEIFDLLKSMIREGVIYVNGKITIQYFNFCVRVACMVDDFDWAEDFIYSHEDLLVGSDRQDVFDHNLLMILFHKKEYPKILRHIDEMKFSTPVYQILQRVLKLKTLYECGESERFFLLTDAFRKFVKQRQEHVGVAGHYLQFVRFSDLLGRIRFDRREPPVDLVDQVKAQETAEKDWLLEKIAELQLSQ
jgi:hypothetical protein